MKRTSPQAAASTTIGNARRASRRARGLVWPADWPTLCCGGEKCTGELNETVGLAARKPKQEPCLEAKVSRAGRRGDPSRLSLKFGKL